MPIALSRRPWRPFSYSRLVCGSVLGLVVTLVISVTPAGAGTYKMYTCNVPGKATAIPTVGPWTWELDGLNTLKIDECASGGMFGIGLNVRRMLPNTYAQLALRRPASGPLSRIGIVRYKTWLVAELTGSGAPAFVQSGGAFGPPGGSNSDANPWVSPLLPQNNASVVVRLLCTSGANCLFESATPLRARGIEVDLYEEARPTGAIDAGTLLADGVQSGIRSLSYSAADEESGVRRVEAFLGDMVVALDDLGADPQVCSWTGFSACHGTRSGDLQINTAKVPDGQYALTLRVTDAAGNRRIINGPFVRIGNGPEAPGSPNGGNASDDAKLSASFSRSGGVKFTTRFGRKVVVRGRLLTRDDRSITGAKIDVSEVLPGSDVVVKRGSARTNSRGRFRYVISRVKSSRSLRLSYRARYGDQNPAAAKRLTLGVRAASSLRVSLQGVVVRYSGRVLTRPVPEGGKLIVMQGRAKGGAWQTFATRRTGRGGRFAGRYRLRVRRPGIRLQFRVRIPRERGYPFAAGAGRPVTKIVR
jgi:hypothetical protein